LDNIRYFSNLYFHGHSVGGTNPSLLEAMASSSLIIAHDNIFNKSILEEDAIYFQNSKDIVPLLNLIKDKHIEKIKNNVGKIDKIYSWPLINAQYESFISECLELEKR
ncbi:MAG: glycosyltransferase family 1 protein, partial [Pseudomonadota bacterium]